MKAIGYISCIVILLLAAVWAGSVDSDSYNDHGLLGLVRDVPESENGFVPIAYTQDEGFSVFAGADQTDLLRRHLQHEIWDAAFVDATLEAGDEHLNSAVGVLGHPAFKLGSASTAGEIPSYLPIMNLSRLLVLHSMRSARRGELDQAIEFAEYALQFSQRVQSESNHYLISYMIGSAMQNQALQWIHRLAAGFPLQSEHYRRLAGALEQIPAYGEDAFARVFGGELVFVRNLTRAARDKPLGERWNEYRERDQWWDDELEDDAARQQQRLFDLLQALFPKYYIHENRMLGAMATSYVQLSEQAVDYCVDIEMPAGKDLDTLSWLDLLKPNVLGNQWKSGLGYFREYFEKRCLSFAHLESVKGVIALLRFRQDTGAWPGELSTLAPHYLANIPKDPFNGESLGFSAEGLYFYSVGVNYRDNGGSLDAAYRIQCGTREACTENPTFPVNPWLGQGS